MKEFNRAIKITLVFILVLGIIFPVLMTGISRIAFPSKSQGSIVYNDGKAVGSKLIGQDFKGTRWFQGRPSESNYEGTKSGASNLSITNPQWKKKIENNIDDFIKNNPGIKREDIPEDIVTSSASGLDPEISLEAADLQVDRVAQANNISENEVKKLVQDNCSGKFLGIFGEKRVNVLNLNLSIFNKTKK